MLDLILTNKPDKLISFNQVSVPGISNHDLVFASFDYDCTVCEKSVTYRDFKNINPHFVLDQFYDIPWHQFFDSDDPDMLLEFFNNNIKRLYEGSVPLKTFRPKKPYNPWFNAEIQRAIIDRDLMHRMWKRTNQQTDFNVYKRMRNRVTALVKKARKTYFDNLFDSEMTSSQFWNKIKSLGLIKKKNDEACHHSASDINGFFSSNFTHSSSRSRIDDNVRVRSTFAFNEINEIDVVNAIYEIKSNAVGLDEIPIKFIKLILPILLKPITHLFNCIINTSMFPEGWKSSKIIPIKKKSNVDSLSNMRPISISCALSKAFDV